MVRQPDPDWRDYTATILEIHAPVAVVVDLRQTLSPERVQRLRALGLGQTWGVLTAHNPGGHDLSEPENRALEHRLGDEVLHSGIPHLQADGVSPDRTHREVGLALGTTLEQVRAFARHYGQLALFWFDGDRFRLVPTDPVGSGISLPLAGNASDDGGHGAG